MTPTPDLLFVYGTLRRDHRRRIHPLLRPFARYLGPANTQARLYDLGRYPGLIVSPNRKDRVHGELYQILSPAKAWPRLDAYEECNPENPRAEYRRLQLTVCLNDGNHTSAWCYVYTRKATGIRRITDGNYKNKRHPNTRFVPSPIKADTAHPLDRRNP